MCWIIRHKSSFPRSAIKTKIFLQRLPLIRFLTKTFTECHSVRGPDKCDSEAPRKKVKAAVTSPDDSGIIQAFDRDFIAAWLSEKIKMRERNTVCEDPLCGPVDGHYFCLEYAAIVRQSEWDWLFSWDRLASWTSVRWYSHPGFFKGVLNVENSPESSVFIYYNAYVVSYRASDWEAHNNHTSSCHCARTSYVTATPTARESMFQILPTA